jgi:type I restriction enzyme R subunit
MQTYAASKVSTWKPPKQLRDQKGKTRVKDYTTEDPVDQLDFEFVLFASAVIDYDYIMGLIAKFANQPMSKVKMSRDELVGLIRGHSNLMEQSDDIVEYVDSLKEVKGATDTAIRDGYARFKAERSAKELAAVAAKHGLATAALQALVDGILDRMIFNGEQLSDLMAPLDLDWKARIHAELALMDDLHPLLTKRASGREISGLSAYEQ